MAHHHHRFIYSEAERRKRQNPESILQTIGLREGMCFIDSGCNDGFFTLPAARIVGKSGKIFAIDIDQEALARLSDKLLAEQINNTTIIARPAEEVIACDHCADIVFFGTVLHDFQDPLIVLKNSRQMLKPDGRIYDFDWRKQDSSIGPPKSKRFSRTHVKQLASQAGLSTTSSLIVDANFYAITLQNN